jgi:hypothetical protein
MSDPDGFRCTGPRFPVLSHGFRVWRELPATNDTELETEDPCTENRPGLITEFAKTPLDRQSSQTETTTNFRLLSAAMGPIIVSSIFKFALRRS